MILEELVLHNFGPYLGRQKVKLAPKSPSKPIVLIGGLNGAGKTTLLDGLHLALYGPRAQCSKRGSDGYKKFLKRSVHRGKTTCTEAGVELEFTHRVEGIEKSYRVQRTWSITGSSVKETVEVFVDGEFDAGATERWPELVEEFLPIGVANLFLFDGEKIQELAEGERSSELVRTAIHGLLGLDIVHQLGNDLKVLERKKRSEDKDQEGQAAVLEAEEELASAQSRSEGVLAELGACRNDVGQRQKAFSKLTTKFEREGGKLFDSEQNMRAERQKVALDLEHQEDKLRKAAMGELPLLLLTAQLKRIYEDDLKAEKLEFASALNDTLTARDKTVIAFVEKNQSKDSALVLKAYLNKDRRSRKPKKSDQVLTPLGGSGRLQIRKLQLGGLEGFAEDVTNENGKAEGLSGELAGLDSKLAAVPEKESLQLLVEKRNLARKLLHQAEGKLRHLESEREKMVRSVEFAENKLVRLKKDWSTSGLAVEDIGRVIQYSEKVRETLIQFGNAVVEKHLSRIESLVLESFRLLLRKKSLVNKVEIEPGTYQVTLRDFLGQAIHPDKLSAGERQLFAVAMLWGLAKSSGRPLPVVIDTPLGRLDSEHRTNMIEHYFPQASHQVLLLSTDEEIGADRFTGMVKYLGQTYTLAHNDRDNATYIEEGYVFA